MAQSSTGTTLPITFYRYRKDGTPNPDIKRAFLKLMTLTTEDAIAGKLWSEEDGSQWTLVIEQPVYEALKAHLDVDCIVSFQVRYRGAYAVARLRKADNDSTNTQADTEDNKS